MGPIAIVLASLGGGGAERVALTLAEEFSTRGVRVDLVVLSSSGPLRKDVSDRVRLVELGTGRARHSISRLRAYLKRERPSAILAIAFHVNLLAILACAGLRPRPQIVLSVHGTFSNAIAGHPRSKRLWLTAATMLLYRRADHVVAVSRGAARDLARHGRVETGKIVTIPNPVIRSDLEALAAESPRHPWASESSSPLIVAAGRLSPAKDYPTLIAAMEQVAAKTGARLLILGEGELRRVLEADIARLGLERSIALPGFVANPVAFMRAADRFVLSSRWEGFAMALVEALAVGTPVVATDCPNGPREILQGGRWGKLVPVGKPEALAHAIVDVLATGGIDGRARARDFEAGPIALSYLKLLQR
jgi:glycosyltransferase involved in cell wall biosynthesis